MPARGTRSKVECGEGEMVGNDYSDLEIRDRQLDTISLYKDNQRQLEMGTSTI